MYTSFFRDGDSFRFVIGKADSRSFSAQDKQVVGEFIDFLIQHSAMIEFGTASRVSSRTEEARTGGFFQKSRRAADHARFYPLCVALLIGGCHYVSHPVINYHHAESGTVMKSYVAGEKIILDQPTLRPYYVNGVLVTLRLSYSGHERPYSGAGSMYSLGV